MGTALDATEKKMNSVTSKEVQCYYYKRTTFQENKKKIFKYYKSKKDYELFLCKVSLPKDF